MNFISMFPLLQELFQTINVVKRNLFCIKHFKMNLKILQEEICVCETSQFSFNYNEKVFPLIVVAEIASGLKSPRIAAKWVPSVSKSDDIGSGWEIPKLVSSINLGLN